MPRRYETTSGNQKPFFKTLEELDEWAQLSALYHKPLKYYPRSTARRPESQIPRKLLVCHDYKGGYTEKPNTLSYTFNFWSSCDTFIYFSHHRVTIPPPGWITASHRQGVKILGTLIFENGGEADCLRLLVGKLPQTPFGQAAQQSYSSLPVSPHYARLLARLAFERGFDGYLLNFECALQGEFEHARSLVQWISLLHQELQKLIGHHAEVVWYDSVVVNGQLRWQDRLNTFNLPFFLPSTGFFTNYTWRNNLPAKAAQYFATLNKEHLGSSSSVDPVQPPHRKTLADIYTGIDVWGRGSHGGGGFGCYKALSHIPHPQSVALFGPAWTWETEQDKPGWNWDEWWKYERKLWVGPSDPNEIIQVPEVPNKPNESPCVHGPFVPLVQHFTPKPPPDPRILPFHTSFCPGVGQQWFIDGRQVSQDLGSSGSGASWWTDLSMQTSLGDMVWPNPAVSWQNQAPEGVSLPIARSEICMTSAWNGGSSLRLTLSSPGSDTDEAATRNVWMPIQRLCITPGHTYFAYLVVKMEESKDLDLNLELSPKTDGQIDISPAGGPETLPNGWTKLCITFTLSPSTDDHTSPQDAFLGLLWNIISFDPAHPLSSTILVGQLNVFSNRKEETLKERPVVLWASFTPSSTPSSKIVGKIDWDVAHVLPAMLYPPPTPLPEDPNPFFMPPPAADNRESFMYFHIFAKRFEREDYVGVPDDTGSTAWIGTTGWGGTDIGGGGLERYFELDEESLPPLVKPGLKKTRIFVRGVTDRGSVTSWEDAVWVDIL